LIGGVAATSFIVVSPTQITATIPARASGAIAVLMARGSATSTVAFMGTSTSINNNTLLDQYHLSVSPNPAQDLVIVKFTLTQSQHISLRIFNTLGQEVAQILDETLSAGEHQKSLEISHLSLETQTLFLQLKTHNQILSTIPLQVLR
jgi:hypothetical protein